MIIVINVVLLAMLGALIVRSMLPKARAAVVRGWSFAHRQLSAGAAAVRRLWWKVTSRAGTAAAGTSQQGPSTAVVPDSVQALPRCIEQGGGGAQ